MSTNFNLIEHKSVGTIEFGMQCHEARQELYGSYSSVPRRNSYVYKKTPHLIPHPEEPILDVFEDLSMSIYYDLYSGECIAIGCFGNEANIVFRGKKLAHESSFLALQRWLDSIGGQCEVQRSSLVSVKYGIKLTAEGFMGNYECIKTHVVTDALVFSEGYLPTLAEQDL